MLWSVDALSRRRQSFRQVQNQSDCTRNAKKFKNPPFCSGEDNEKVIRNPHADPDHHQKLITSTGSSLAHDCQVWSTSVSAFISYIVYRMTERSHNLRHIRGGYNFPFATCYIWQHSQHLMTVELTIYDCNGYGWAVVLGTQYSLVIAHLCSVVSSHSLHSFKVHNF